MDVSIIIPVYNTPEESLLKCFNSMNVMAGFDYEVVVVDDGSEEKVGNFCQQYVNTHERFRYVFQNNSGVSAARNMGITRVTGKYIMFVDADDELLRFEFKQSNVEKDWDVVFFDVEIHEGTSVQRIKVMSHECSNILFKKDLITEACHNKMNAVWGKLFRRSFLLKHDIRFDEAMVVGEDAKFVFTAIVEAENLCYEDICIYRYNHSYDNGDSRIARHPRKNIENAICLYQWRKAGLDANSTQLLMSPTEIEKLYIAISTQLIKDIFEAVGILAITKQAERGMNDVIYQLVIELRRNYGRKLSLQTRVKCSLLQYEMLPLIKLFALLRKRYLKGKTKEA